MSLARTDKALHLVLTHSAAVHAPQKIVEDALAGGVVRVFNTACDEERRTLLPAPQTITSLAALVPTGYLSPPLASVPADWGCRNYVFQASSDVLEVFAAVLVLYPDCFLDVDDSGDDATELGLSRRPQSGCVSPASTPMAGGAASTVRPSVCEACDVGTLDAARSKLGLTLLRSIDNAILHAEQHYLMCRTKQKKDDCASLGRNIIEDILASLFRMKALLICCFLATSAARVMMPVAPTTARAVVRGALGEQFYAHALDHSGWGTYEESGRRYDATLDALKHHLGCDEDLGSLLHKAAAALEESGTSTEKGRVAVALAPPISSDREATTQPGSMWAVSPVPSLLLVRGADGGGTLPHSYVPPGFVHPTLPSLPITIRDFHYLLFADHPLMFDAFASPLTSILQASICGKLTTDQSKELRRVADRGWGALSPSAQLAVANFVTSDAFIMDMVEKHGNKAAFVDLVAICIDRNRLGSGCSEEDESAGAVPLNGQPSSPHSRCHSGALTTQSPSLSADAEQQHPLDRGQSQEREPESQTSEASTACEHQGRTSLPASTVGLESLGENLIKRCIAALPIGEPLCHVVRDLVQRKLMQKDHFFMFVTKAVEDVFEPSSKTLSNAALGSSTAVADQAAVALRLRNVKLVALLLLNCLMRRAFQLRDRSDLEGRLREHGAAFSDVREFRELVSFLDSAAAKAPMASHRASAAARRTGSIHQALLPDEQ